MERRTHRWEAAEQQPPPPVNETEEQRKRRQLAGRKLRKPLNRVMRALEARRLAIPEDQLADFNPNKGRQHHWRDVFAAVNQAYAEKFPGRVTESNDSTPEEDQSSVLDDSILGGSEYSEYTFDEVRDLPVEDPSRFLALQMHMQLNPNMPLTMEQQQMSEVPTVEGKRIRKLADVGMSKDTLCAVCMELFTEAYKEAPGPDGKKIRYGVIQLNCCGQLLHQRCIHRLYLSAGSNDVPCPLCRGNMRLPPHESQPEEGTSAS